jgi:polyphosphate kinase
MKRSINVVTESKSGPIGGEVLEAASETAKVEQYWVSAKRSRLHKPPKDYKYVEELTYLQVELIKMQEWVKQNHLTHQSLI